jgi:crotonobetainyl-CoA:carnitine CoA-transferase CaiB-like acyl-CoA transferase
VVQRPMEGVRILEVAQFTFTPAAGGVLADWGADVIKVEHAETGDAQRGLKNIGPSSLAVGTFHPIMDHPNRGKRSIGLDLANPQALEVLYAIARTSDVFLTNFLPAARRKLKIDVEHLREVNPQIIYVRGSAFGALGPEAEKGGYDASAFWARAGSAAGVTPPDLPVPLGMPAPAYGDSIGGMTIAGGIAGALFGRERTGEPSVVDVSLLSTGAWANGLAIDLSLLSGEPWTAPSASQMGNLFNPVVGAYKTADGKSIMLMMLQPFRFWADFVRHIDRPDLIDDPRFGNAEDLIANAVQAIDIIGEEMAKRTFAQWCERFATLEGQWAPVQDSVDLAHDAQLRANGYIAAITDADGNARELMANPVQFDETPAVVGRGPLFAEHTDEILRELGHDDDAIIELKIAGAVT